MNSLDHQQFPNMIKVIAFAIIPFIAFAQDVSPELTIVSQPTDISIVRKDKAATLSFVVEKGDNQINYQWYQASTRTTKKGVPIEGATNSTYTTSAFTKRDIRYYYCIATAGEETVTSEVATAAYTGIPTLFINTQVPMTDVTKETYVFGYIDIDYQNDESFTYVFSKEENGINKEGVKGRGNSSWARTNKKGYNIKFDKKQSLFNLPASKKWSIIANYADKTLLRNSFAAILGNEIFNSIWNPHFISLDVVWNGEYRGNYTLCEKNIIGSGRVAIQDISDYGSKKFIDYNGDGLVDLYDGGFILEIDNRDDGNFHFQTKKGIHFSLKDPDEVSEDIQNHIQNIVQNAEDALYGENSADTTNWRLFFDESSAIDWYIVNMFAASPDMNYTSVFRYYNPIDGKIYFGPNWDFDISFGNHSENGVYPQWEQTARWVKNTWIQQMLSDSAFFANFKERWNEKKKDLQYAINTQLQNLADTNAISAKCNFFKWNILGKYIWPNNIGAEERKTYQSEIDYMVSWLNDRFTWLDKALEKSFFISYDLNGGTLEKDNPSVFISQNTSPFTLSNPTRYGFIFDGWSGPGIDGKSNKIDIIDDGKGDKVYTANWARDTSIKDIELCDVMLQDSTFIYEGSAITPSIKVSDEKTVLVENIDYTVSYINNDSVGIAKIVVTGMGEYSGEKETDFQICAKDSIVVEQPEKKETSPIKTTRTIKQTRISVRNRNIQIYDPNMGNHFVVFDTQGIIIQEGNVDGLFFEIPISKAGVLIVRVGSLVQQIRIK